MKQVIPGGAYSALHTTDVRYNTIVGWFWGTSTTLYRDCASPAGTLSRFLIKLNASPGAGTSYTFVIIKNGAATDVSVTIADAATEGSNTVDSVSIVGGDLIAIRCTPSGTPTARYARWSIQFEGTTAKQSWIPGGISTLNTHTYYAAVWQGAKQGDAGEASFRQIIPTAGKIKNLYVRGDVSPGGGIKTYRLTLRKGGVSTALTCDVVGGATTANNTIDEVTVAAGDVVTFMAEPINSPTNDVNYCAGFTFVADTDGESVVLGVSCSNLGVDSTQYNYPSTVSWTMTWLTTEAARYHGGQPTTFKKLYVLLSGTPGAGKSYLIGVRVNGSTKLSVTIADLATTGSDLVNSFLLSDHDVCNMISTPTGSPTARTAHWGFVGYIAPAAPPVPDAGTFFLVM